MSGCSTHDCGVTAVAAFSLYSGVFGLSRLLMPSLFPKTMARLHKQPGACGYWDSSVASTLNGVLNALLVVHTVIREPALFSSEVCSRLVARPTDLSTRAAADAHCLCVLSGRMPFSKRQTHAGWRSSFLRGVPGSSSVSYSTGVCGKVAGRCSCTTARQLLPGPSTCKVGTGMP